MPEPHRDLPPTFENLKSGSHPFAENPSFGSTERVQGLARGIYEDVLEKVRRYTGVEAPDLMRGQLMMLQSILQILKFEAGHESQLATVAKRIISEEFNLRGDEVILDAKIGSDFDFDGVMADDGGMVGDDEPAPLEEPDPEFTAEFHKRRAINGIIQGAARKGQYLFHMAEADLRQIHPDAPRQYGTLMALNELSYWVVPDDLVQMVGSIATATPTVDVTQLAPLFGGRLSPEAVEALSKLISQRAGVVKLDFAGDVPTIRARAVTFPMLVHELYKGMVELVCSHGLPKDVTLREQVIAAADRFAFEPWDLRLGPALWGAFLKSLSAQEVSQRFHLLEKLVNLPPAEFHPKMRALLAQ